jgi:histidinol-phosphatase (PHP family)
MHSDELKDYVFSIRKARLQFPRLKILCGMECDYLKEYHNFYQEELLGKWELDYLIAGVHFFSNYGSWGSVNGGITNKHELKSYARAVISAMDSGLFSFISHPDMFANSYLEWDAEARAVSRDILAAASCCGVLLEINSYGLRKEKVISRGGERAMYPLLEFWKLAKEYKIKAIVNSDAHSPQELREGIEECTEFAIKLGLALADFSPSRIYS